MRLVKGFEAAKEALSRRASPESYAISPTLRKRLRQLFATENPEQAVRQIIDEVRTRGDAALFDYTFKIDQVRIESLEVGRQQIDQAHSKVDDDLLAALSLAAERIRSFHEVQRDSVLSGMAG